MYFTCRQRNIIEHIHSLASLVNIHTKHTDAKEVPAHLPSALQPSSSWLATVVLSCDVLTLLFSTDTHMYLVRPFRTTPSPHTVLPQTQSL